MTYSLVGRIDGQPFVIEAREREWLLERRASLKMRGVDVSAVLTESEANDVPHKA